MAHSSNGRDREGGDDESLGIQMMNLRRALMSEVKFIERALDSDDPPTGVLKEYFQMVRRSRLQMIRGVERDFKRKRN